MMNQETKNEKVKTVRQIPEGDFKCGVQVSVWYDGTKKPGSLHMLFNDKSNAKIVAGQAGDFTTTLSIHVNKECWTAEDTFNRSLTFDDEKEFFCYANSYAPHLFTIEDAYVEDEDCKEIPAYVAELLLYDNGMVTPLFLVFDDVMDRTSFLTALRFSCVTLKVSDNIFEGLDPKQYKEYIERKEMEARVAEYEKRNEEIYRQMHPEEFETPNAE